ncbi:MAG: HsmA family protein, partial [Anaerolineales bacterium]
GVIAILLMLVHAIWATVVLLRKDERAIVNFHKFSLVVWLIWLVPYFSGFFLSMGS